MTLIFVAMTTATVSCTLSLLWLVFRSSGCSFVVVAVVAIVAVVAAAAAVVVVGAVIVLVAVVIVLQYSL